MTHPTPITLADVADLMMRSTDLFIHTVGGQLLEAVWRHASPHAPCWECDRGVCCYPSLSTPAAVAWLTSQEPAA